MKLSNLNEWITLGSNLGVLLGLIFLIVELDQSNRVATYSAVSSQRSQYSELNRFTIENSELAFKLAENRLQFTEREAFEAYFFALYHFNVWLDSEAAYDNGLISRSTFDQTLSDIQFLTNESLPGLRQLFREMFEGFDITESKSDVINTLVEIVNDEAA